MRRSLVIAVLTALSVTNSALAAVFGQDTRQSILPHGPKASLGRSTAVAVLSSNRQINPDGTLDLETMPANEMLCSDQKFSNDVTLSYACTGFLVAPDILVTAGHCAVNVGESRDETESYCDAYEWLFDYRGAPAQTKGLSTANLYRCKRIIYAVHDERPPFRDYAVIQLDRPVLDRVPLKIATDSPRVGAPVFMLGHPLGMPLKLSSGAKVLRNDPAHEAMVTNLDAFDGNSGSPVFNANDEVIGILVRGTPHMSFLKPPGRECSVYNRCDDNGRNCLLPDANPSTLPGFQQTGSDVQRIGPAMEVLRQR